MVLEYSLLLEIKNTYLTNVEPPNSKLIRNLNGNSHSASRTRKCKPYLGRYIYCSRFSFHDIFIREKFKTKILKTKLCTLTVERVRNIFKIIYYNFMEITKKGKILFFKPWRRFFFKIIMHGVLKKI